eukprot:1194708-Prorocentrum_minimum.AAC.2
MKVVRSGSCVFSRGLATVEDTRSEVERKFPEFFHSKLTSEGYHVESTPMTVLNPNHPNFIHKEALKGRGRAGAG